VIGEGFRVVGGVEDAALPETCVDAQRPVQLAPKPQAFETEFQLAHVAMRCAAPAPVAARLFACNMPFLAHRDGDSLPGEIKGRAHADNPAADHDNIDALG
jgi:hypothetical protein